MTNALNRILDANLNRAREGLRVVEEIVRLAWEQPALLRQTKTLRHALQVAEQALPRAALLSSRAAAQDPGATLTLTTEKKRRDFPDLVTANLRRTQEALRVLEEVSKLGNARASGQFKRLRFRTYQLESALGRKLARGRRPGRTRRRAASSSRKD